MNAVEGNSVNYNGGTGITALSGGEVSSMAYGHDGYGIRVSCPGNATANTATSNGLSNLLLIGAGCNASQNVAP